ncbi:MAG TPA: prolipoprotein diacylglyceryl transferase family protein, partial [Thermoanaerobaculia bacterium]
GYAIGRVGCFLVGDDYGRPTDQPWGVAFPVGLPETTAGNLRDLFGVDVPASVPDDQLLRVHPTQLYETGMSLVIWALGLWMIKRGARPGATTLTVLVLLAVERLLVEFLRAKDDRFFGVLTLAQLISIGLILLFAGIAWYRRGRLQARAA